MMALYFITGNDGKFSEVKAMLPGVERLGIDLPEVQSMDSHDIIKAKLLAARELHGGEFMVEDTSLSISGLGGLPGPLIKWFLEALPLEKLAAIAVASGDPSAEAKVCIGYLSVGGEPEFFEGVIKGMIVPPRGEHGFGWDKVFVPEGYGRTFGEMDREVKNRLSMRRRAVELLRSRLERP